MLCRGRELGTYCYYMKMITDNYNLNTKFVALWLLRITNRVTTTTFDTASKKYNKKCGLLILWDTIIMIDPCYRFT